MKKILYFCTNPIEDWEIFIPKIKDDQTQHSISLLLLHKEQNLEQVFVSHVWYLNENETEEVNSNIQKTLSYREILEQVFSHDLSVVI